MSRTYSNGADGQVLISYSHGGGGQVSIAFGSKCAEFSSAMDVKWRSSAAVFDDEEEERGEEEAEEAEEAEEDEEEDEPGKDEEWEDTVCR